MRGLKGSLHGSRCLQNVSSGAQCKARSYYHSNSQSLTARKHAQLASQHLPRFHRTKQPITCTAINRQMVAHEDSAVSIPLEEGLAVVPQKLSALYRFSRPHTMLGTFISVCSVSALAVGPNGWTAQALVVLLQALVPALLMNVCIVGLNQIFDVPIDKINKPYLPLASGEFSMRTGVALVVATGSLALAMGVLTNSTPLLATLLGSLLLGIAYSTDLPFLRWKQYPVIAAACILAVRAVMVQLGFFFHMKMALGSQTVAVTRPLIFAISFMLLFSVVIALFKDIPDVKGDAQEGVRTLSVRVGVKTVFWTCIVLMEVAYAGAIGVGMMSQVMWSRGIAVGAHALLGLLLFWRAKKTDLSSSPAIYRCYMFTWKLFYAEYLLIPFLC
ncbi:g8039 [Coccomyxa elongata]